MVSFFSSQLFGGFMKTTIKKILLITMGTVFMAIASTMFFAPHSIAPGGVYGLSIVINHLFPNLQIGTISLIGNIFLYIIGLIFLGKQFGLLTLYGTISFSVSNIILERSFPIDNPVTNDLLVSAVIGSGLMAIGLALVMRQKASTGGTDIIVRMLHDYAHVTLSGGVLLTDGIVVIISAFAISLESALYAVIAVFGTSFMLEEAITGADRRIVMNIISKESARINRYINIEMDRGTTIYQGKGGYSKKPHDIIVTVVQRHEYIRIKDFVEKTDSNAFIYVYHSTEVMGEGFTRESRDYGSLEVRASNYVE